MASNPTRSWKRRKVANNGASVPAPTEWAKVSYCPKSNTIFDHTTPKVMQRMSILAPQVIPVPVAPPHSQSLYPSKPSFVVARIRGKTYPRTATCNGNKTENSTSGHRMEFSFSDMGIVRKLSCPPTNAAGKFKSSLATKNRLALEEKFRPVTRQAFSGSFGKGCRLTETPTAFTKKRKAVPRQVLPPIQSPALVPASLMPLTNPDALLASPGALDRSLTPFMAKSGFGDLQAVLSSGGTAPPPPPLLNPLLFDPELEPKQLSPVASAPVPTTAEAQVCSAANDPSNSEMFPEGITKAEMEFALTIPIPGNIASSAEILPDDPIESSMGDFLAAYNCDDLPLPTPMSQQSGAAIVKQVRLDASKESSTDTVLPSVDVPDLVVCSADDKWSPSKPSSQPFPASTTKAAAPVLPRCSKRHSSLQEISFTPILPKGAEPNPFPPTAPNAKLMSPILHPQRFGGGKTPPGVIDAASYLERGRMAGDNIIKPALGAGRIPPSSELSMLETACYASMLKQSCVPNGGGSGPAAGILRPPAAFLLPKQPPFTVGKTSPILETPGLTNEVVRKGGEDNGIPQHLAGLAWPVLAGPVETAT